VVVMKGGCSFIVSPEGRAWSCGRGNVGLATSGSGDTLAGIIAGLLARGAPPLEATLWGVFLHGEAGARLARRQGLVGFLARELLAEVPPIMAELSA
jgi:ADP-dependent NAD(P)H-hydrate dehydratase